MYFLKIVKSIAALCLYFAKLKKICLGKVILQNTLFSYKSCLNKVRDTTFRSGMVLVLVNTRRLSLLLATTHVGFPFQFILIKSFASVST